MTVFQTLKSARSLISTPETWCKGKPLHVNKDTKVKSYCLVNAINISSPKRLKHCGVRPDYTNTINFLSDGIGAAALLRFNDHKNTTHNDVIGLLDTKIKELSS